MQQELMMNESHLYFNKEQCQVPLIYRKEYNIKLFGLQKLHPFDAEKWGNVINILKKKKLISEETTVKPNEADVRDLKVVHTKKYLDSLKWSICVAKITEVPPAIFLPNFILQRKVLSPLRYQTGGSILGGKLAIENGWAINIGGGFHHCSSSRGGGFCAYADITLTIRFAMDHFKHLKRFMIIDLDAHQGNGHERDFIEEKRDVYILDIYNKYIYPRDTFAKQAINRKVELSPYTEDSEYLQLVKTHVEGALNEFNPEFVLYNAGTDILIGDQLGLLSISSEGVITRDEIVWLKVRSRNIPLLMVTSGGYQRSTAAVIADSIENLNSKGLIKLNETSTS